MDQKYLEDGRVLKEAIEAYLANQTKENYQEVIEILRDSMLWNKVFIDGFNQEGLMLANCFGEMVPYYTTSPCEVLVGDETKERFLILYSEYDKGYTENGEPYTMYDMHMANRILMFSDDEIDGFAIDIGEDYFFLKKEDFSKVLQAKGVVENKIEDPIEFMILDGIACLKNDNQEIVEFGKEQLEVIGAYIDLSPWMEQYQDELSKILNYV